MFSLIKQVFIALLSFSKYLANKWVLLNDDLLFIDLNLVELKYYPFMINLDKCNRSCNSINDLSMRICVLSKTKDINVKIFDMVTNRNEV